MEGATSTLAETLLDDLDDLSDVEEEEYEEAEATGEASSNPTKASDNEPQHASEQKQEEAQLDSKPKNRFVHSTTLQKHLETIRNWKSSSTASLSSSATDRAYEHECIVQSNKYWVRLAEELEHAHGNLRLAYKPKFPELEEIIPNPIQYTRAVRVIANETDMTKVNTALNQFLSSNQIITISVAGSTTAGRELNEAELKHLFQAADAVDDILNVQDELTQFIESRMEGLAPNTCALIGHSLAARMVGLAGGLQEFSKIPACNLQVLGQHVRTSTIQTTRVLTTAKHHQGILAECDLVQKSPMNLQKKVLKAVASKLALAARCDFVNVDAGRQRTASSGQAFRHELEQKIEKWHEPDKAPTLKALPKPDMTTKKRRGGKRMRRLKERYEETTMMKQANTRAFSAQAGEYGDDAMGLTVGLLDTSSEVAGGNLRKTSEKRKMRQANTKASRKRAAQMDAKATTSGLASSMVFTPVQGMELVNPDAQKDKVAEANRKWFGDNAGFVSALPKK